MRPGDILERQETKEIYRRTLRLYAQSDSTRKKIEKHADIIYSPMVDDSSALIQMPKIGLWLAFKSNSGVASAVFLSAVTKKKARISTNPEHAVGSIHEWINRIARYESVESLDSLNNFPEAAPACIEFLKKWARFLETLEEHILEQKIKERSEIEKTELQKKNKLIERLNGSASAILSESFD